MRPHSWFRRSVSFALAMLVLITSVGFTVQRMTCRMSGQSLVAVAVAVAGQADLRGCAEALAPVTPTVKDNCCDFSKQLHKLSIPTHELAAKILVPAPLLAILPSALTWPATAGPVVVAANSPRWFAADSSPPPLGGRELLALACTLVV